MRDIHSAARAITGTGTGPVDADGARCGAVRLGGASFRVG